MKTKKAFVAMKKLTPEDIHVIREVLKKKGKNWHLTRLCSGAKLQKLSLSKIEDLKSALKRKGDDRRKKTVCSSGSAPSFGNSETSSYQGPSSQQSLHESPLWSEGIAAPPFKCGIGKPMISFEKREFIPNKFHRSRPSHRNNSHEDSNGNMLSSSDNLLIHRESTSTTKRPVKNMKMKIIALQSGTPKVVVEEEDKEYASSDGSLFIPIQIPTKVQKKKRRKRAEKMKDDNRNVLATPPNFQTTEVSTPEVTNKSGSTFELSNITTTDSTMANPTDLACTLKGLVDENGSVEWMDKLVASDAFNDLLDAAMTMDFDPEIDNLDLFEEDQRSSCSIPERSPPIDPPQLQLPECSAASPPKTKKSEDPLQEMFQPSIHDEDEDVLVIDVGSDEELPLP